MIFTTNQLSSDSCSGVHGAGYAKFPVLNT